MRVRLADGTWVQARGGSASVIPSGDHETPNWGLYLDEQWRNRDLEWPHQVIAWPDFELPPDEAELFTAIVRAWDRAKAGETVEIACDGGTGRTGTVVACLAVLSGVPVDDAVSWTRRNYHRWAVEVPEQEQLIARFASWLREKGGG